MERERPAPPVRDRARRAVQRELVEVAQRLFVDQGYAETSVDEIAKAAGISRRSFFRYFGNKEDIMLGKYEQMGETLLERFAEKLPSTTLWEALRYSFEYFVLYAEDPSLAERAAELDRVITASPTLRAGYLDRMQRIQDAMTAFARDQAATRGHSAVGADPAPRAIVGAAFACLTAAAETAQSGSMTFRAALDTAMVAVKNSGSSLLS